jgi:hypothetical protein
MVAGSYCHSLALFIGFAVVHCMSRHEDKD